MENIISWFKRRSTEFLFSIPIIFGIIVPYLIDYIGKMYHPDGLAFQYIRVEGTFTCFLFGCGGIVLVVRKDLPPSRYAIKGTYGFPALILGIIWIIFWWGLALSGLIRIIHVLSEGQR